MNIMNNLILQFLINSLDIDLLVEFFRVNKFKDRDIKPYEIIKKLDAEKQKEFIDRIEDTGLSTKDKKMILATLSRETKENIDKSKLPPEYITTIQIQYDEINNKIEIDYNADLGIYCDLDELIKMDNNQIINSPREKIDRLYEICPGIMIAGDFNKDLEIYRGLDKWININPMKLADEQKENFLKLCEICPEMNILDDIGFSSTVEEYKNAENWIDSVLQGINHGWTDIQKVAYIDNAVGKKIRYTPEYDTELDDINTEQGMIKGKNERNMRKIVNLEEGVCVGITELVIYMLKRIGIEAERVDSENHTFIKLKNIELPIADGGVAKGDTILDSTWNLKCHRFGIEPQYFCRSYKEIRKDDIVEKNGKYIDTKAHENDEALASATLSLDEKSLREVFSSIGVANKDGNFPIEKFMRMCSMVNAYGYQADMAIEMQLRLLSNYCPEFAICQNETASILKVILNNINFKRCVVNRVYERTDENKSAVLYVYADLPEAGKKFYFADKETETFVELPEEEFEQRFECYKKDLEKQNGHRPWEYIEENQEYLYKNSIPAKDVGGRY